MGRRSGRGRYGRVLVALAMVGVACGNGGEGAEAPLPERPAAAPRPAGGTVAPATAPAALAGTGTTAPQTLPILVGGGIEDVSTSMLTFLPRFPQAHPGDTLEFRVPALNAEPQTVTFGKLVEPGLDTPEGALKLPWVFPSAASPGPPQMNQSGARPCFLDTSLPPASRIGGAAACEQRTQPDFTGTEAFYNSGLLFEGDVFRMRIAAVAKPGSYAFTSLNYGGRMFGKLTIVEPGVPVPPAAEVEQRGVVDLRTTAAFLANGRQQPPSTNFMLAGVILNSVNSYLAEFIPTSLTVPVGSTVTFGVMLSHTISFNAAEADVGLVSRSPDGSLALNARAFAPADSPTPLPSDTIKIPGTASGSTLDAGVFDGTGFKSSGLLSVEPPARIGYKVTFVTPGVYEVRCLVHPRMKAQITVA